MLSQSFDIVLRVLTATVFVLTASWKLAHQGEFDTAFQRLGPAWVQHRAGHLALPLAGFEFILAIALVAGLWDSSVALLAPVVAGTMIALFTVALVRAPNGDCGCWTTPAGGSSSLLNLVPVARNITLIAALGGCAALSSTGLVHLSLTSALTPAGVGVIVALFLVEAPQIVSAVTFERPARRATA